MNKFFQLNIAIFIIFLVYIFSFISGLLSIYIAFFVFLFFCFFVLTNEELFSYRSLIFFTAAPYFMAGIIDYLFFDNSKGFDPKYLADIVFYSSIFFISFYFSTYFLKNIKLNIEVYSKESSLHVVVFYLFLILIYCSMVQYYVGYNIGSVSRAEIYANKSLLLDIYKTSLYIISVLVFWNIFILNKDVKKYLYIFFLLLFVFLLTEVLVLGDRKQSLVILMSILSIFSIKGYLKFKHYLVFFSIIILFFIYGAVRNRPIDRWGELLLNTDAFIFLNPANMEFGAFTIIWHDIYNRYNGQAYFDLTYMYVIDQLIPSFINSNREIAPSVKFVKDFYPDIYEQGGGMAFNSILESILNFGFLGPVILGLGVGFISKFCNYKTNLGVLFVIFFVYNSSFFFRVDMVSIVRGSIIFLILLLVYVMYFCSIKRNKL